MLSTLLLLTGTAPIYPLPVPQEPEEVVVETVQDPAPTPVENSPLDNLPADGAAPITTESGLTYSIVTPGDPAGTAPTRGDEVVVRYTGWLTDGAQFDSSNGSTAQFRLGEVVEGWNEGLTYMTPGSTFKFTIPSDLGYGERGSGGSIPPGATLIFLVELVDVIPGPELLDFVPLVGETVQTTEAGTRYLSLAAGTGDPIADDSYYALEFVVFKDGEPMVASAWQGAIRNTFDTEQIPFLKDLRGLIREGAEFITEYAPLPDAELPDLTELIGSVWHVKVESVEHSRPIPAFQAPDPAASLATAGGYTYQVLTPGAGDVCGVDTVFELDYVLYSETGEVVDSSYGALAKPIRAKAGDAGLPILRELPALMSAGQSAIAAMPIADFPQAPPQMAGQTTCYWHFTLQQIIPPVPAPEFRLPAAEGANVTTTASGLRIEVLEQGNGAQPQRSSTVEVHYAGWLTDGTGFDNSFDRGAPSQFGVGQVIPGWTEALLTMKVGTKALLYIPAAIGYGARGVGSIPPNSDLVFYVDMLQVL